MTEEGRARRISVLPLVDRRKKKGAIKMKNRKKLEDKVYKILANIPDTRNDDYLLTYYVIESFLYENGITSECFFEIMANHNAYNLPSIEGITRTRRRLQRIYPNLRATKETEEIRRQEEERYREEYRHD